MNSRWTLPVPLQTDELFSSWLVRAALTQGCDPLSLTGLLWPDCRVWMRDPDRGLGRDRLKSLATVSGIDIAAFEAATLVPAAQAIAPQANAGRTIWPWMLALGSRNRRRHAGIQYCPACLQNDQRPYFRLAWRMAWHTCCPQHGLSLLDRCPQCLSSVEPHRLPASAGHLAHCANCRYDLRSSVSSASVTAASALQEAADRVLASGTGNYGCHALDAAAWFELARYFVMIVRKTALMRTAKLERFAALVDVQAPDLKSPATGFAFELLPVQERAHLLGNAWQMLHVGPQRFVDAAMDAALTKASIHEKRQPVPATIARLIQILPDNLLTRRCRASGLSARPRSCKAVMRMHARLQRKLLKAVR